MNIITHGATTIAPDIIDGFDSRRDSANIVHEILGRSNPDITFRPAGLRTGTLTLVFASETESAAAENVHVSGTVFTIVSTDRATIQMTYVVQGEISRKLDAETRDAWVVEIGYQEVTP